jgi:methylenetetrahydrofolate reductase (NADPH)
VYNDEGRIPGAVVVPKLLRQVLDEWKDKKEGERRSIERAARLSAVLKGLGYRGIHVGGIHGSFSDLAGILDRMEQIQDRWMDFVPEFDFPQEDGFYVHEKNDRTGLCANAKSPLKSVAKPREKAMYLFMGKVHDLFFDKESFMAPALRKFCAKIDGTAHGRFFTLLTEDVSKEVLLSCLRCGDCGIQHVAFLCPESQCPKHMRNGACGGSRDGGCEVYPDRPCVWVRAYKRLASANATPRMAGEFVPPRLWELNKTSSWINFHLGRDHQTASCSIASFCGQYGACPFQPEPTPCE